MSEFHIRSIGVASLALGVIFQITRFAVERCSWDLANPSFSLSYAVHPYFVYGAFTLQFGLQTWWLLKPSPRIQLKDDKTSDIEAVHMNDYPASIENYSDTSLFTFTDRVSYMPVYTFSNNCIILWTIAFQWKLLVPAILILSTSACMQFYGILAINHSRSGIRNTLTAVVVKLNTAYTILLLTETWAAYEESYSPSILQLTNYGVVFLLIVVWSGPDTIFATALIYVLAALYHGSVLNPLWRNTFYWTAAVIAVVAAIDFLIHNLRDNEEQDQRMDLEHNLLFSGTEKMPLSSPQYMARIMERPVPIAICTKDVRIMALCSGGSVFTRDDPVDVRSSGDKPIVMPDYFSYAFHV